MVILSSTAMGVYFSTLTKGRVHDLKAFKKNICLLRGDIRYAGTPLPEAMSMIGNRSNDHFKEFFLGLADEYQQMKGETFVEIWRKGTETYLKETYLTVADREQVARLGENLGFMDKEMQIKTIDLYLEQLDLEIEDSQQSVREKTRIYNLLGVLAGVFVTIIFI